MRTITKEDQARAVVMIFHEMRDAVLSRLDAMPPDFDATDLHILVRFVTDSMLIPEKEVSVERRELLFHFFMKNSLDAKKPLPDAVVGHVEQFLCGDKISVRYGGGGARIEVKEKFAARLHEEVVIAHPHDATPTAYPTHDY